MKFNKRWLEELIDIKISVDQLINQLTMAGLEVDKVTPVAADFSNVFIGQIVKISTHPNADKLHICEVNVGEATPLQIVCGANNIKKGMKVPVALLNAVLADGLKIKKAKIRGVESYGMLCSGQEIGLASTDGILALSQEASIGVSVKEYLVLDDQMIDIDLTPNRGDCASLIGIAREVSALTNCKFHMPPIEPISPTIDATFPIRIEAKEANPRYAGRVIKNINPAAVTPMWMQERLRRCGVRSIAPVVDVTNYVLLELGQPMHSFDLEKLNKEICVRFAKSQENLTLLNEEIIDLTSNTLVITDNKGPIAIAGVMGGKTTGVSKETKHIFLESAFFSPANIVGKARQYGLQTDSSYRFERGVDPELQVKAIERATKLLLDIAGGEPGPISDICMDEYAHKSRVIRLRPEKVRRLLGVFISDEKIKAILESLGMLVTVDDGTTHETHLKAQDKKQKADEIIWQVQIPSWRFDLQLEADLIEEAARINGYDNIPISFGHAALKILSSNEENSNLKRIRELLQDRGYHEVINYSFVSAIVQKQLDPNNTAVSLVNPIVNDMEVMRTNLWPGLLKALTYNLNRQQERIKLFETGLRFINFDGELKQEAVLSGLSHGDIYPEQWGEMKRLSDFFDVKGDVEALLQLTNQAEEIEFRTFSHSALHPGQAAKIIKGDKTLGCIGVLHPNIAQSMKLPEQILLFELKLDCFKHFSLPKHKQISKFPVVRRDLALLVDRQVAIQEIKNIIKEVIGKLVIDLRVFDLYCGKGIDKMKKSVALGLTLQHPSRTLKDSEINELVGEAITTLQNRINAQVRN